MWPINIQITQISWEILQFNEEHDARLLRPDESNLDGILLLAKPIGNYQMCPPKKKHASWHLNVWALEIKTCAFWKHLVWIQSRELTDELIWKRMDCQASRRKKIDMNWHVHLIRLHGSRHLSKSNPKSLHSMKIIWNTKALKAPTLTKLQGRSQIFRKPHIIILHSPTCSTDTPLWHGDENLLQDDGMKGSAAHRRTSCLWGDLCGKLGLVALCHPKMCVSKPGSSSKSLPIMEVV